MLISSRTFERHLDWIGQRFHFISLEELASTLDHGAGFARPVAAITFDDGYRDVYDNAFPILKRKGIPAAVFVVTGLVDTPHTLTHDRLYALLSRAFSQWPEASRNLGSLLRDLGIVPVSIPQLGGSATAPFAATRELLVRLAQSDVYRIVEALEDKLSPVGDALGDFRTLTWEMLAEMSQSGITIGSHTRTHILLTNEDQCRVQQELEQSRQDLETKLGIPIRHFAYPDGRFSSQAVRAVAAAGYRYAYTTCCHRDSSYPAHTIPRRIFWENSCLDSRGSFSPAIMSCQISGSFDFLAGCKQDHRFSANERSHSAGNRRVGSVS